MSSGKNIENMAVAAGQKYNLKPTHVNRGFVIHFRINNNKTEINSNIRGSTVSRFLNDVCNDITPPITTNIRINLLDEYEDTGDMSIIGFSGCLLNHVLIPDLYAMDNYGGKLSIKDTIAYNDKMKKALFIGASTGSTNPANNQRLRICEKYRNNPNIHCYINSICQVSGTQVGNTYPNYKDFVHASMSIGHQRHYKYLISVDGNTSAWDRVPWILNSNSVLLMKKSDHKCWYYEFLLPNVHYIPFDDDTDLEAIVASDEDRSEMIRNANQFVQDYLVYDRHKLYMQYFLKGISSSIMA